VVELLRELLVQEDFQRQQIPEVEVVVVLLTDLMEILGPEEELVAISTLLSHLHLQHIHMLLVLMELAELPEPLVMRVVTAAPA
jgi:hypothetical protein